MSAADRDTTTPQSALLVPRDGEVRVWYATTTDAWSDADRTDRALSWLTTMERLRYERYRHDVDREMFLLGRVMARTLVGQALGVEPRRWSWQENRHGRPELSDKTTGLSFNLAHSAGVVVCAVSRGTDVGTDIEFRGRDAVDQRLVRRFCSPSEVADIESRGRDGWRDRFLQYWTLKEAYLKARGVGIAVHLSDLSFTLEDADVRVSFLNSLAGADPNWAFALSDTCDRHFIAAATPAPHGRRPTFRVEPLPLSALP